MSNPDEQYEFSLVLDGVSHQFGSRAVFEDVRLILRSGQTGVITGSNGAGKSTLLRIVAGLLPPASGTVALTCNGRVLDRQARREYIGYVAPDLTLYRELTGAENLTFFARLQGLSLTKEDLIERLTEVGLRGRGRDIVGTYSSGMRQRLKYAFALLNRPAILLLDEPTANLDIDGVAIVQNILANHRQRPGSLALIATNEPEEIGWGDTIVHLTTGRAKA